MLKMVWGLRCKGGERIYRLRSLNKDFVFLLLIELAVFKEMYERVCGGFEVFVRQTEATCMLIYLATLFFITLPV